jgi:hypothetical protein
MIPIHINDEEKKEKKKYIYIYIGSIAERMEGSREKNASSTRKESINGGPNHRP